MKNCTSRLSRDRARPIKPTGNTSGMASLKLGPNRIPTTSCGTAANTTSAPAPSAVRMPAGVLLFGHGFHDAWKQHLAHAQGQEIQNRADLVQAAVDACVVVAQVVLGEDDVLVVEDQNADDARRGRQ